MKRALQNLVRVSPHQLRAFEATARTGAVTRAAKELHVSQPTVSAQLKELALLVGEPLFEAQGRGIRLTATGALLHQTVGELVDCWQRFDSQVAELNSLLRGRLSLAAVTTAEYFVPDLLGPFAVAHPGVEVELVVENRDRIVERLQRGADDLTVMMLPPPHPALHEQPFMDNHLVVIGARHHRLAGQPLTLHDLAAERWLLREPGSGTRQVTEQQFESEGFAPERVMSLGSNEAIKHAVAAGLGVAVLSQLALGARVNRPVSLPWTELQVAGFPLRQQWRMVWRRDRRLSPAARRFAKYAESLPAAWSR